jgi:hypothetical protein
MDQGYVIAASSGTAADVQRLREVVSEKHPQARRLDKLGQAQSKVRGGTSRELWLDEDAGVLLDLQRKHAGPGKPEAEDPLTLSRVPLRSADGTRLVAALAERPVRRLDDPMNHGGSKDTLIAMDALDDLFAIQLVLLRLDRGSPAAVDQAIGRQVAQARTPREASRRRAFRDWHVRRLCGSSGETRPADAARALGYDVGNPPTDLAEALGAYLAYRDQVTYEPRTVGRADGTRIRLYYEFRTAGRQLTDEQVAHLQQTLKYATVGPGTLTVDLLVDKYRFELPWQPAKVFADYFDAGLHFDQGGERTLWLRLPAELADQALPFQAKPELTVWPHGGDLLVAMARIEYDGELSYRGLDPRPWLRELLPLRNALIAGDLRALEVARHAPQKRNAYTRAAQLPELPLMDQASLALKALDRFLTEMP